MPQGPAKKRNEIVSIAYKHAQKEGLSSLSIRSIAKECNIAIGTIYNYFPDKAALVTEVISAFWSNIAFSPETRTCLNYQKGENLITFCERLYNTMNQALGQFRSNWLGEVNSLDPRTKQKGREAENACFEHIYTSLEKVIQADSAINQSALDAIHAQDLAYFIWNSMYNSLHREETNCSSLLSLLKLALYS